MMSRVWGERLVKNGGRGVEMREMQQVRVVTNWEFTGVGREAERPLGAQFLADRLCNA